MSFFRRFSRTIYARHFADAALPAQVDESFPRQQTSSWSAQYARRLHRLLSSIYGRSRYLSLMLICRAAPRFGAPVSPARSFGHALSAGTITAVLRFRLTNSATQRSLSAMVAIEELLWFAASMRRRRVACPPALIENFHRPRSSARAPLRANVEILIIKMSNVMPPSSEILVPLVMFRLLAEAKVRCTISLSFHIINTVSRRRSLT